MYAPLVALRGLLGTLRTHIGDVLSQAGLIAGLPSGRHPRSDLAPQGTPAAVTVSKTECSRQPTCSVEC